MDYLKEFMDEKLIVDATHEVLQWLENNTDLRWTSGENPMGFTGGSCVSYSKKYKGLCSDTERDCAKNITSEEFLNGVKLNNIKFTKDMLVAGKHAVKFRENDKKHLLLFNEKFVDENGFVRLSDFNSDLINNNGSDWDIIEVYKMSLRALSDLQDERYAKLIWKRKEKTPEQLKMEELREKQITIAKQQAEIAEEMAELEKKMQ